MTDLALTHLDVDHVGGIVDSPSAKVHLSATQLSLITPALRRDLLDRLHPAQWDHGPRWTPHVLSEAYAGRPTARIADGVRLAALDGHLSGHCGVVIERPGRGELIHAGDAIFSSRTVSGRPAPPGLALFERHLRTERAAWADSRRWLRERHAQGCEIVSAHEPGPGPG
ncbi:MBL fold metallo-hydrolase [Enemella dayhoffiae]|uniref:MBL fold metallo-hydrolase n=1 Tax=Enemella dayhoffiae TaxID=2016507 RepID=UPI001E54F1A6|nr:MBL fold metallo-hydrolase [Enemella dayhoffiae]